MNEQTLPQLEQFLEQAGSIEIVEDASHRYALRRALLNSPRFEQYRFRVVWTRLFTYTTTLVAGGAVVAVMVVSIMTVELGETTPVAAVNVSSEAVEVIEAVETVEVADAPVHFASFEEESGNMRQVLEFARPDVEFAVVR